MPTSKGLWVLAAGKELKVLTHIILPGKVYASPIVANGTLYVASNTGLALGLSGGNEMMKYDCDGALGGRGSLPISVQEAQEKRELPIGRFGEPIKDSPTALPPVLARPPLTMVDYRVHH